ncbi:MAG: ankyrin repeat domain-containing protein [Candidatus Dependentiae bacterium]|nr:ankyrin repeat domain-containing protein [Candidatus Dependentiae bacterium]
MKDFKKLNAAFLSLLLLSGSHTYGPEIDYDEWDDTGIEIKNKQTAEELKKIQREEQQRNIAKKNQSRAKNISTQNADEAKNIPIQDTDKYLDSIMNKAPKPAVKALSFDEKTPKYIASIAGTEQLLSNLSFINIKDNQNNTPLHLAVLKNDESAINGLLENNARVNEKNSEGKTPLDIAFDLSKNSRFNRLMNQDVIKRLRQSGAKTSAEVDAANRR